MGNGYSLCLNKWALDKDIKNELGLLLIISSLCAKDGYCYASNEYLANLFDTNETTISRKLKILTEKDYINIKYEKRGGEILSREIRLSKMITDDYQNCKPTVIKNDKYNNISINNISKEIDNNKLLSTKKVTFQPPTLEEVIAYCEERNKGVDGKKVYDYYSANDWKDSKGTSIKNWKQKIIGVWEKDTENVKEEEYNPYELVQDEDGAFIFRGEYDRQRRK